MNEPIDDPQPVPFADSYWVVPNLLLAGEYPGHEWMSDVTRQKTGALLDAGIRVVIDLTSPGELTPYRPELEDEASRRGLSVSWERFSIPDWHIPLPELMTNILNRIDQALAEGQPAYVHCWGGVGRTGTVVACYLIRHGAEPEDALTQLQKLRARTPKGWRDSPESQDQFRFVRNWDEGPALTEDDW